MLIVITVIIIRIITLSSMTECYFINLYGRACHLAVALEILTHRDRRLRKVPRSEQLAWGVKSHQLRMERCFDFPI